MRGPAGSAVLKVARLPDPAEPPKAWRTSDDPAHWNYWRREWLAYEAGLAGAAYAESAIAAATLLEAKGRPDGAAEL